MADNWREDFNKSQVFFESLRSILAKAFIIEAPIKEDIHHNTDLFVMMVGSARIACRVRDMAYYHRYPGEFTIRYSRPRGTKTEFHKLMEGWGDYFLYGYGERTTKSVMAHSLIDLDQFRKWFLSFPPTLRPGDIKTNGDGTQFIAFRLRTLPADCIVSSDLPANYLPQKGKASVGPVQGSLFGLEA